MEAEDWKPSGKTKSGSEDIKSLKVEDFVPSGPTAGMTDSLSADDDPFLTHLAQGLTLGTWDEFASKVEAAVKGNKTYREAWQDRQDELERYRKLAPGTALAGEMTGSALSMLIPMGVLGNVARAGRIPTFLRTLMLAAGQGAVEGMGKGTRPYTDPEYDNPYASVLLPALDATKGAFEGMAGVGIGKALGGAAGLALSPLKRPVKAVYNYALEKTAKPIWKIPEEVAREVLDNPSVYRGKAKSIEEITDEKILPLAVSVSQKASQAKNDAVKSLTDRPAARPSDVINMVLNKLEKKDVIFKNADGELKSNVGQKLISELQTQEAFANHLAGKKGYLTEKELHRFYEVLKPSAKFSKTLPEAEKKAAQSYKDAVGAVRERLGTKNETFDKEMLKSEDATIDIKDLKKAIGLKDSLKNGARYEVPDTTYNKLRQIRKKETTQETLRKFVEKYGDDQTVIAQLKRATNEKHFGLKAPFVLSGASMQSPSKIQKIIALTRDVFGPNLWKQAAVLPSRGGPGVIDSLLRPAFVTGSTSPTFSPEYMGTFGMTAEEYRAMKAAAAEESRTE